MNALTQSPRQCKLNNYWHRTFCLNTRQSRWFEMHAPSYSQSNCVGSINIWRASMFGIACHPHYYQMKDYTGDFKVFLRCLFGPKLFLCLLLSHGSSKTTSPLSCFLNAMELACDFNVVKLVMEGAEEQWWWRFLSFRLQIVNSSYIYIWIL